MKVYDTDINNMENIGRFNHIWHFLKNPKK